MKLHTKQLTLAALTAAAYAVLSYFGSIFGITYGPIQCRFSEALCVLPFFLPETAWGSGVGCLIANLLSPYGVLDIVVGSAATLLAALLTARCQKKWLAPLPAGDRQHRAYRPGPGLRAGGAPPLLSGPPTPSMP
ncbi:MAG: QueT transporter family protein [Dysosmobacter sp.]